MADKKPATAPTVTLKHLAAQLAEDHQLSKKQSEQMLGDLVTQITKHLKKGDRIRIGGLGIPQARRPHGPQSCDRRADSDQGFEEGGVPCRQGIEGSDLIAPDGAFVIALL